MTPKPELKIPSSLPPLQATPLRPLVIDFSPGDSGSADARPNMDREWCIPNGVGGYAASTIFGMNTRRSHGLLVASTEPNGAGRIVLLSGLQETVVTPREKFPLYLMDQQGQRRGGASRFLVQFRLDPWPTYVYRVGEILLEKKVFMLPNENAVVIGYTLHAAPGPVRLDIRPLLSVRPVQQLSHRNERFNPKVQQAGGRLTVQPYTDLPPILFDHSAELVELQETWHTGVEYRLDMLSCPAREDLWSFGHWAYLLEVGEQSALVASTGRRGTAELAFHERRVENTQMVAAQNQTPPGDGPLALRLSWSAEDFLVRDAPSSALGLQSFLPDGVPAGRDALIALPGLLLATGRADRALGVLEHLGSRVKDGLIPVRFSEEGGFPEYDSADTSLWYIQAVWHLWKSGCDLEWIREIALPVMEQVVEGYLDGTLFGIRMEEDGLIALPDETIPLTWMDAWNPGKTRKHPGCAVTPRNGCPVEINGLWYCALKIMEEFEAQLDRPRTVTFRRLSELVRKKFLKTFVSPTGAVHDRVVGGLSDPSIRPNALIAAGLPFSPLDKGQIEQVLKITEAQLLTPVGIRTLSPRDSRYRGNCTGDLTAQMHALHQGTVWSWLMGPYVSAVLKARHLTGPVQRRMESRMQPFLKQLETGTLGFINGWFDGDAPHTPRGGAHVAAAGELLRILRDTKLKSL